ncbi:MAG: hypothetical protein FWF92_07000 [Oscillospiraceae bacterium]|nr:hypothetical protein [Oscillospiraceae bacterium]
MKKISLLIIFALIISSLSMFNISAVAPEWTYQCAKSVYDVNINGKIDGNEWDDAIELIVNNDSEIFKKYGYWQGGDDHPIPSSDLSVTYKVKWDDDYLYILEVRYDKNFSFNPDDGDWPWEASGTLFFLYYDKDGEALTEDSVTWDYCYEIFWVMNPDGGSPKLTGRGAGKSQFEAGDPEMDGWVTAQSVNGDTYTFEAAIPWATMQKTSEFPAPAEGLKLRFTPIVSAYLQKVTASAYDETWNQLDFYVDTSAADNPAGYGGMELVAAIVAPQAEAEAADDEPVAQDVPDVSVPVTPISPTTGDAGIILFVLLFAIFGSSLIGFRKSTVQK